MITRTAPSWQTEDWQNALSSSVRSLETLWQALGLPLNLLAELSSVHRSFPVRVPQHYLAKIRPGDPLDPLLLQILPQLAEEQAVPGFSPDPLSETKANPMGGLLHKYRSRVLLVVAGACAVNCRYCFRRHFPYQDNGLTRDQLLHVRQYLESHPEVNEVILSGGDPLMVSNSRLAEIINMVESVASVSRLRIHTRLPVVIPQRVDSGMISQLRQTTLSVVLVTHSNHPRELDGAFDEAMAHLRAAGVTLLNQSVILRSINDSVAVLADLSERLFAAGVLPYYLHLLDPVAGAHHFNVPEKEAVGLVRELQSRLSGFLVPRLVKEVPGQPNKTLIDLRLS